MDVIFQTRFSFYGKSGWKSAAAADPALLFAPERLDERLALFEAITLASLKAQTDGDFTHLILSSTLMPEAYQRRLRELVKDTLGDHRVRVLFRPEGHAGSYLRGAVHKDWGERMVAQVVLDDDDALANDFTAELRRHAPLALTASGDGTQEPYAYLSFPRGFTLGIEDGKPAWLERRYVPYTNLGLTLVAPANSRRNPFNISHRKVGLRHPSLMVTHQRPCYLRAVHDHNDSRAVRQKHGLYPGDIDAARAYFPFLAAHFPPEAQAAAE
jgi:Putative rhamnosyl transferase